MPTFAMTPDDRDNLIDAFLAETDETLARLEEGLLQLEQSHDDEILHEVFRAAHTLKGNAACLQFDGMTALAHAAEELLERIRNGEAQPTPLTINRLLDTVDAFRDLAVRSVAGDVTLSSGERTLIDDLAACAAAAVLPLVPSAEPAGTLPAGVPPLHRTLRVAAVKLDRMLDLTGEIAIARGHIGQQLAAYGGEQVVDSLHELDRLNHELQELVMHARLVPLAPALRPFHRVVRDLAARQEKRVNLVIDCGDVEVDTAVIEQLKDPVTHMIRNAIDHGIETPDDRMRRGRPAAGTIRIAADQENGGIVIRFSDDGRGIDPSQIAQRARALGLETERLTRGEILALVFEPGFSTAKEVSDLSGRGVGLDIVRRNVEGLRGSAGIASETGEGTTITLRLPLTVAVIEGFAVRVADETYVIPIESVVECTDLPSGTSAEGRGVLNVRGEPVPFLRLRSLFGFEEDSIARQNVVIVQSERGRAAIVVDELLGSHQTVMKPLRGHLRRIPAIAGSSILGSGRVALIVDVPELLREAIANSNGGKP